MKRSQNRISPRRWVSAGHRFERLCPAWHPRAWWIFARARERSSRLSASTRCVPHSSFARSWRYPSSKKPQKRNTERSRFKLRQAIEEQRFAIEQADIAMFFASDERMHQSFAEMAGRSHVWSVISDAKRHLDRLRLLSLEEIELNLLLKDHSELLDAIESHDPAPRS